MRILIILSLLCSACTIVHSACKDLIANAKRDVEFPDIEKDATESFTMAVEYTAPNARQTDYYIEYYDTAMRQGKVEGHQAGKSHTYIYKTKTFEAWEIAGDNCTLQNLTAVPDLWIDGMNQWLYDPEIYDEIGDIDYSRRVWGPSAMFKNAWKAWNVTKRDKMAYMGKTEFYVRGLKAQYWRRCDIEGDNAYVDYYFTADDEEDPLNLGRKRIPLRVYFGGDRPTRSKEFQVEQFEILTFQPSTPLGLYPFQLPKGLGCQRRPQKEPKQPPKLSDQNLRFSAEVIYRKVDNNGNSAEYWSYYSTLTMTLDLQAQHLAYYYTPWNASKPDPPNDPEALPPQYVIYDMKHGYAYVNNVTSGKCNIIREKSFVPEYELPQGLGKIALTDPSILFPNSELTFITEGFNRGLAVDVYEEIVENYTLDNSTTTVIQIPKAIITHSYLQENERVITTTSMKNALSQVKVRLFGRKPKITEEVTFNFYLFSNNVVGRRFTFNTQNCFKNDDDYVWVTIGFNADKSQLEKLQNMVPSIQSNILNSIYGESELVPMRIPYILVDFKEGLFVTLLILGKPPIMLDYLDAEPRKKIQGSVEDAIKEKEICAQKCLEEEVNCWGFSICGGLCTYGHSDTATEKVVAGGTDCTLYRRYDNITYIESKEKLVIDIQQKVAENNFFLVIAPKDKGTNSEGTIQLQASSVEVMEPGEDDDIFTRVGNEVNPRMRTFKAGAKLKVTAGQPVRNLGALRFDECQRICLDFKECETVSYCMRSSECIATTKFGEEIPKDLIETDDLCTIVTRTYADNFDRSPGNVLSLTAQEVFKYKTVEECAKACLKSSGYQCLSFDHCPQDTEAPCKLHTVHYPTSKTREKVQEKSSNCGHYFRKFSTEFRKTPNKQTIGASLTPLFNMTLEECSKMCKEYGKGTCWGFDFCQDSTLLATSCTLLNSDPSQLKSRQTDRCTNFLRTESQFAPRPYSNGYAGGIGFLCFLIGLVIGAVAVFGIAYIKVNRR